ncbi:hypothetical protein [Falsirhodobacter sp. 1013]|uniref:hypothetical protein n=1 Tax=Falsirhodobacter sp. 1013 TaxID=3417566 RepID=UPI003EBBBB10
MKTGASIPKTDLTNLKEPGGVCRGVAYQSVPNAPPATQACAQRIIWGTADRRLMAVDALTGHVCQDFGTNGPTTICETKLQTRRFEGFAGFRLRKEA